MKHFLRAHALLWLQTLSVLTLACGDDPVIPVQDDPGEPDLPEDTASAPPPVRIVETEPIVRLGDVLRFSAELGEGVEETVTWQLVPEDAGQLDQDGRFVGQRVGKAGIVAALTDFADTLELSVRSRGLGGTMSVVGRSALPNEGTTDLWVSGTTAYTVTRGRFLNGETFRGNAMHTWDVTDPAAPVLTATIRVDASTVNDVKVSADGELGVITHEGSGDKLNGITLLDLSDPKDPQVITRFTEELTWGVHNVWIEGDYVYAAAKNGGGETRGLRVIDVSTPAQPRLVAMYYGGGSFIHDVYVREGLAFLSHWDLGLVILDVGNGIAGGSPESPVEVSRIPLGGNTHNAWYWPETGYVFVGEEDFNKPGVLHVVDASDLTRPVEVATYGFGSFAPHNVWLDEAAAILYVGWYGSGVLALDVSGELWGSLALQGRLITRSLYNGLGCGAFKPDCTMSWAPQFHDGLVYVSDMGSGLWILRPDF
jgi:hypothetical protein